MQILSAEICWSAK